MRLSKMAVHDLRHELSAGRLELARLQDESLDPTLTREQRRRARLRRRTLGRRIVQLVGELARRVEVEA